MVDNQLNILKQYFDIIGIKQGPDIVDGKINLICDRILCKQEFSKFPIKFGTLAGALHLKGIGLTTLEGSPDRIKGQLRLGGNNITTMYGIGTVTGYIAIEHNLLTDLKFCPKNNSSLYLTGNKLTSLEGLPMNNNAILELSLTDNLPILRLLKTKFTEIMIESDNGKYQQLINIIGKFRQPPLTKKAILDCQKELIDNGFVGNASW
jgi:hypothetical protein